MALLAKPEAELKISADIVAHYCGLANENCFFVQIGANDGITDDSLHSLIMQYRWQGILVEPQSDIFEKLRQNYLNQPQLIFRNVALSHRNEVRDLYRIHPDAEGPYWLHEVASFDRMSVLKNARQLRNGARFVVAEAVKCVTFGTLLKESEVVQIDWLQIDAEGFDYEILKMVDFAAFKPRVICYEHRALSRKDWNASVKLLFFHGYQVAKMQNDTIACLPRT